MRINGKARMGCSALVDNLEQPIRVEPLSKFPLVRDLQVDRTVLFENLMAVKAWVPVDGTYDLGSGRASIPSSRRPITHSRTASVAAVAWTSARSSTNLRICGRGHYRPGQALQQSPHRQVFKEDRLRALAGDGGIQECGFAQNCVDTCPSRFR